MLSLEALTLQELGSPQVFQTGETFNSAPLVDYQHPHDFIMGLNGTYQKRIGAVMARFGAGLVDEPTLGPPAFMHRPSGRDNPQVPLSHHNMGATHITHGVVQAGADIEAFKLEGSWFHGREPDENRFKLELGPLDSWAARISWRQGPWHAQVSRGHLKEPERLEPFDVIRLTASVGFAGEVADRPLAALAVWGQNREIHGILDAYLLEATYHVTGRSSIYGRAELTTKDILDAGGHPQGFFHAHRLSRVGAFTLGHQYNFLVAPYGRFGLGADVTGYYTSTNLADNYGNPVSFHVYLRYRPAETSAHGMRHD